MPSKSDVKYVKRLFTENADVALAHLVTLFPAGSYPEDYPSGKVRNAYRASLVVPAVVAFIERCHCDGEEMGTVIGDLIGDLLHLRDLACPGEGVVSSGEMHYEYEVAGE